MPIGRALAAPKREPARLSTGVRPSRDRLHPKCPTVLTWSKQARSTVLISADSRSGN